MQLKHGQLALTFDM
ncbi:hypothetical protein [Lacticaseibacillus rhamnosus]|nr:hypothetical protein LL671_11430 [Lacticaseibacillus rhamnosus]